MGFIDKAPRSASIGIEVNINNQNLPRSEAPYFETEQNPYPCFENILYNSKTWGMPECVVIKIPAKFLKKGKNEISFRFIADKKIDILINNAGISANKKITLAFALIFYGFS